MKTKHKLIILLIIILAVTSLASADTEPKEYSFACPPETLCFIDVGHNSKVRFECDYSTDRFVIGATRHNQGDLECYGFPR